MTGARRRANRLPPTDRHAQLLACAIRVFARRGLGRGGHAEIAAEAGVAIPTVFAYFKTRAELLAAVLEEVARYYNEMADNHHRDDNPAPRALLDHAVAFAASVDSHADYARVLLDWSTAVRDEVWPLYLRFHDRMAERFEATLGRGQSDGSIPADLDRENTALMLVGSAFMVVQMKFTRRAPEKVHRFLLAMLRAAIGPEALSAALR